MIEATCVSEAIEKLWMNKLDVLIVTDLTYEENVNVAGIKKFHPDLSAYKNMKRYKFELV